jgi:hypothetical protein
LARAAFAESAVLGDAQKLESAGFGLRGTPEPIPTLDMVQGLKLKANDYTGVLFASWKPVRGAKGYEVQLCADPLTEANWESLKPATVSKTVLEDLTTGTKYWVRVRAVAHGLDGPWSQPGWKVAP